MGAGKKWSTEEDKALARAYVYRSANPVKGTDSKNDLFWDLIHTSFCFNVGASQEDCDRTTTSLMSRWKILGRACQKWEGITRAIIKKKISGYSPEDENLAKQEMYKKTELKSFHYHEVYEILQALPKFDATSSRDGEGDSESLPIGRDSAKRQQIESAVSHRAKKPRKAEENEISSVITSVGQLVADLRNDRTEASPTEATKKSISRYKQIRAICSTLATAKVMESTSLQKRTVKMLERNLSKLLDEAEAEGNYSLSDEFDT